jgi:hypothetical protein
VIRDPLDLRDRLDPMERQASSQDLLDRQDRLAPLDRLEHRGRPELLVVLDRLDFRVFRESRVIRVKRVKRATEVVREFPEQLDLQLVL